MTCTLHSIPLLSFFPINWTLLRHTLNHLILIWIQLLSLLLLLFLNVCELLLRILKPCVQPPSNGPNKLLWTGNVFLHISSSNHVVFEYVNNWVLFLIFILSNMAMHVILTSYVACHYIIIRHFSVSFKTCWSSIHIFVPSLIDFWSYFAEQTFSCCYGSVLFHQRCAKGS